MIDRKVRLSELEKKPITINGYRVACDEGTLSLQGDTSFVFGLGERFNAVNQKNHITKNQVTDKFCNQGEWTYFPLPFFFLENNTGIYIDTKQVYEADFRSDTISIFGLPLDTDVYVLSGSYKEIISDFITLTGNPLMPPQWTFGPWMSAHRWNSQIMIEDQLRIIRELEFPMSALVIEQWSDEATFYVFNQARYDIDSEGLDYADYHFDSDGLWPNPKQMIDHVHAAGLKLVLWQIPVIKALEPHEKDNPQLALDEAYAIQNQLIVTVNEKPYRIPKGHWFPGSLVPDFTNEKTIEWWFKKRQYLFDLGVDGFKTDGGECILNSECRLANGETGKEMLNDYSRLYIETYKNQLNDNQVLFSRAGYTGQQKNTIHWAGDQKSTWSEFRSIYNAGLSASLSGQHLWSFDIGGFAGDLPSVDLYVRATQLAVFSPIMQFHSEPIGGQFALLDPSKVMNNERTPWNMADYYGRPDLLQTLRKLYWLRMNLIPYLYSETRKAIEQRTTMMRHLIVDYPDDPVVRELDTQHMLGDLLVVPILNEEATKADVYFPEGRWINIFTQEVYPGKQKKTFAVRPDDMLVFIREGTALIINHETLFAKASNRLDEDQQHILLFGPKGETRIVSTDHDYVIQWANETYRLVGHHPEDINIRFL